MKNKRPETAEAVRSPHGEVMDKATVVVRTLTQIRESQNIETLNEALDYRGFYLHLLDMVHELGVRIDAQTARLCDPSCLRIRWDRIDREPEIRRVVK